MAEPTGSDKTAIKTATPSPRSGVALPLGNHPGNTGGKPGRSGRPPKALVEWAKEIVSDEDIQRVYTARAAAGDLKVFEFAAERAEGKAKELKEISGEVTVKVVYDVD